MKKLGKNQVNILESMIEYKGWQKRCGWIWVNYGTTVRLLDSLVNAGYVMNQSGFYYAVKGADGNPLTTEQKKIIDNALSGVIRGQNENS